MVEGLCAVSAWHQAFEWGLSDEYTLVSHLHIGFVAHSSVWLFVDNNAHNTCGDVQPVLFGSS